MRMTPAQALDLRDKLIQMVAKHGVATLRKSQFSLVDNTDAYNELCMRLFELLPEMRVVLWNEEIYLAATNGADSFIGTMPPAFEKPSIQFWITDNCALTDETKELFELPAASFLIGFIVVESKFEITSWLVIGEPRSSDIPVYYRYMFSQERDKPVAPVMARTIAGIQFLSLPFVVQEDETSSLPRPIRRAAQTGRRPKLPEINTVCIRRPEGKPFTDDNQPEGVKKHHKLSYQFLVNSFWRKPYKNMKEPRPVYVRAHVRGPRDTEFKATRPIVYRANK